MTVSQLGQKQGVLLVKTLKRDTLLQEATLYLIRACVSNPRKTNLIRTLETDLYSFTSEEWRYVIRSAIYDLEH